LDEGPDIGLVHGEVEIVDAQGNLMPRETNRIKKIYQRQRRSVCDYPALLQRYVIFSSTVLVRRECIEGVGFYDTNSAFLGREDYDLYLRLSLYYSIYLMEGPPVAQYRFHEGNVSSQYDPKTIAQIYIAILKKQLTLIDRKYKGLEYRKLRSRILAKLAEFYALSDKKEEVRTRLFDAFRLDPTVAFDWHSLKRLIFSFF